MSKRFNINWNKNKMFFFWLNNFQPSTVYTLSRDHVFQYLMEFLPSQCKYQWKLTLTVHLTSLKNTPLGAARPVGHLPWVPPLPGNNKKWELPLQTWKTMMVCHLSLSWGGGHNCGILFCCCSFEEKRLNSDIQLRR